MDDAERARFRDLLMAERRRLQEMGDRLRGHGLEDTQGESLSELTTYDNHPADVGSETCERSKDLALYRNVRSRLRRVEDALGRLEAGDYGVCRSCGRAIDPARLEAVPEADLCRDCRAALERAEAERGRFRPAEEELLSPPFGRSFLDDDPEENVMYDGEDAWQEVSRYGTSETPQDVPDGAGYENLCVDAYERRGGVTELENRVDEEGEELEDLDQDAPGRGRTGRT